VHGASKCLQARPFKNEVAPLAVVTAPVAWIVCTLLGLCVIVPQVGLWMYLRF
jgi:hypothetical protein